MLSKASVVVTYQILDIVRILDTIDTRHNEFSLAIRKETQECETKQCLRTVKLVQRLTVKSQHLKSQLLLLLSSLLLGSLLLYAKLSTEHVLLTTVNKHVQHYDSNQLERVFFVVVLLIIILLLRLRLRLGLLCRRGRLINYKVVKNIAILQYLRQVSFVDYNVLIARVVIS